MNLSTAEMARYAGLLLGTSGTFALLGALGLEAYVVKLLIAIAVGVGLGWAAERAVAPGDDGAA